MFRLKNLASLTLVVFAFGSAQAWARGSDTKITGIYSSFEGSPGEDLNGYEMWIVWDGYHGRYSVALQLADEGPDPLALAEATVKGDEISFVVPEPAFSAGTYRGRISAGGFDGYCLCKDYNKKPVKLPMHLKRGESYWQKN